MQPAITRIEAIHVTGMRKTMSFSNDLTMPLWQGFGPRIKDIPNRANGNRINLTNYLYPVSHYFNEPMLSFERWAAVEVNDFSEMVHGLETFIIPAGLYAVFEHRGTVQEFEDAMGYIYTKWMPEQGWQTDDRPHFEIMGPGYRQGDSNASETVFVPVKKI